MEHSNGLPGNHRPAIVFPMMLTAFVVSLSSLSFQVALTRVFSVVLWYHFVFAVVSSAVLGIGLGGTVVHALRSSHRIILGPQTIAKATALLSLTFILSTVLVLANPFTTLWGAYAVLSMTPFLLVGIVMSSIFSLNPEASGYLCFADLTGAAIGSLAATPLLNAMGPVRAIYLASALLALASLVLFLHSMDWRRISASQRHAGVGSCNPSDRSRAAGTSYPVPGQSASGRSVSGHASSGHPSSAHPSSAHPSSAHPSSAHPSSAHPSSAHPSRDYPASNNPVWIIAPVSVLFLALYLASANPIGVNLSAGNLSAKTLFSFVEGSPTARVVHSSWDSFSRVDVVEESPGKDVRWIFTDGGAGSEVFRFDGDLQSVSYLRQDPGYAALDDASKGRILIIGSGGGKDVLVSKLAGFSSITAVEINKGVVDAVERMKDYAGPVYSMDGVETVVGDGRGFIRQSSAQYDVIYLPLVFSQAAERVGYGLAENYVFTAEAFGEYLDRLNDDGRILFKLHDTPDLVKAVTTMLSAFRERGIDEKDAMTHMMVMASAGHTEAAASGDNIHMPILAVYKQPLDPSGITTKVASMRAHGLSTIWAPYTGRTDTQFGLVESGRLTVDQLARQASFDASPATDDRPFFYNYDKGLPPALKSIVLLVVAIVAVLLLWATTRISLRPRALRRHLVLISVYCSSIGAGFMLIELGLIQRFVLYLGNPTLGISVAIGTLLLFGGVGSLASSLLEAQYPQRFMKMATAATGLILAAYLPITSRLYDATLSRPLDIKLITAGLSVAPLALFMGMAFPSALRYIAGQDKGSVALMWSVNGVMSVVGSVAAVSISIIYGYSAGMVSGLLLYLLASSVAFRLSRVNAPAKRR